MTLHPHAPDADPARNVEALLRAARAASHERKLEAPIAKALAAIVEFGAAVVARSLQIEATMNAALARVAELEAKESLRVHRSE